MVKLDDLDAALAACPRPVVGAKVERDQVPRDPQGRTVPGIVLSIVDDPRAFGGWIITVRWWQKHRKRWTWETYSALDFIEEWGMSARVRIRAGTR